MNANDVIARLRELRAKATAGEWKPVHGGGWSVEPDEDEDSGACAWQQIAADGKTVAIAVDGNPGWEIETRQLDANIAAIVAAMNSLEPLLACAEALEVFARAARSIDVDPPGDHEPSHGRGSVTAGDLRKARAALDALAGGGE
jgi:hypothetical protein